MSIQNEHTGNKNLLLSFLPKSPYIWAYIIIFIVLWETKGMSDARDTGFPVASTFLFGVFLLMITSLFYKKKVSGIASYNSLAVVLFAEFVFFCFANFSPHQYIFNYTKVLDHLLLFNVLFYTSVGVFVLTLLIKKFEVLLHNILLVLAMIFSGVVIYCSIESGIDTHLFLNMASDYFLDLKNPYNYNYPDIYNGEYTALYGDKYYFNYWPLALYIGSIFRWAFGDVRYSFVLAQIIFACILIRHRNHLSMKQVVFFAVIWLMNLVVLFVNERSWLDALVPPFFLASLLLIQNKKFGWAAVLLGLMASIKLYYVFALPFFGIYYLRERKFREIIIMGLAFASTFLPFVMLSFDNFYFSTITFINGTKIRMDSLSLVSVIQRIYNIDASFAGFIIMFVLMGIFLLAFFKSRNNILNVVKYINLTFFGIFLFSKQSFCNYFYFNMLCAFIIYYLESNFDYGQKKQHGIHI